MTRTDKPPDPGRRQYSVAGIQMEFHSQLGESLCFELPRAFEAFASTSLETDLRVTIASRSNVRSNGSLFYDSGLNWRIHGGERAPLFECYHPPSSRVVALAASTESFRRYDVLFDEGTLRWLNETSGTPAPHPVPMQLPHPLDQLLVLPVLAGFDGFLVHAAGAVVNGRALVFAGHSGDGKTTLSRMLDREGVKLLSDERIAIRRQNGVFVAYGTPWPGEGGVVSASSYPLGGVFLLRKGDRHRIEARDKATLAAELLSRSIVPYYFPETTRRILGLLSELCAGVRLAELEFSLSPGLSSVLSRLG